MSIKAFRPIPVRKLLLLLLPILLVPLAGFAQQTSTAQSLQAELEAVHSKVSNSVVTVVSQIAMGPTSAPGVGRQEGIGSGFVYDGKGHIVTNFHVVENASSVTVVLKNGDILDAKVVGSDPSTDLAVLEVKPQALPAPLEVTRDKDVQVGEFVLAIGAPFGLTQTMTFGIVSALNRTIQAPNGRYIGQAIQTQAPINPGNSGGPLLNLKGEVVGVNDQIVSPGASQSTAGNIGIGFAVPASLVQRVVPSLIATGSYAHPWLGIEAMDIVPGMEAVFQQLGVSEPAKQGVEVVKVVPNGPAAEAGLKGATRDVQVGNVQLPVGGDIIVGINDTPINSFADLSAYLESEAHVGETVQIHYYNPSGQKETTSVTLSKRPTSEQ